MVTNQAYHATQESVTGAPQSTARDRVSTAVYSTTNYSQFKFDAINNRGINQAKLERLYDAIEKRNLLSDNPILVSLDYVVLDGQHRLRVAEAMGVSIYYHFASDTVINDVPDLNSLRTSWNVYDYLRAWCNRGAEDYLHLREFMNRFDWMPIAVARQLCYYGDNSPLSDNFMHGKYKFNDGAYGERVAYALLDFRAAGFKFWNSNVFMHTVANLMANAEYDHKRMQRQLEKNSAKLRGAVTMDDYFVILTDIYNYGRRGTPSVTLRKLGSNEPAYRQDKKAKKEIAA